jgi:hypothetical protein
LRATVPQLILPGMVRYVQEGDEVTTLADFKNLVAAGGVCDDDGTGYYSEDGVLFNSDNRISCRLLHLGQYPSWARYVVWFNK